jgi:DNA-binding winged helix-turn-helix (wHTH) protein
MHASARNGERLPRDGFMSGEWAVAPSRNLLVRGEEEVHVEPRVMDVLVYLAERAGQVVSKDDLMARLWQDRCVTDDVLTVTIYALRKALGDDARRPRYIETVSRRGYRWIAPVDQIRPPGSSESRRGDATARCARAAQICLDDNGRRRRACRAGGWRGVDRHHDPPQQTPAVP